MNKHSAVRMHPLTVVMLAIAARFVSSRPNGASPLSCANMEPRHPLLYSLTDEQPGKGPYTVAATWDIPKKMIRVSVSGDRIQGFLIQGRNDISGPAIGSFVNIIKNPNATYQDCELFKFGKYSSVTHSNTEYQKYLEFYWIPPANFTKEDNVTFFATLAKNRNTYWLFRESNTLPLNMAYAKGNMPTKTTIIEGTDEPNKASVAALSQTVVLLLTTLVLMS